MNLSRILAPAALALTLSAPLAGAAHAATPDSTSPSTSPSTTSSSATSSSDPTLLTYSIRKGTVDLTTINDPSRLVGAPASFKRYAKTTLRAAWQGYYKGRPACKGTPVITVLALRTDGFALGNAGDHPQPGCQAGGGYQAIWAIRHGEWKQVIGTQDIATCAKLEKFGIPSDIGVHECANGTENETYSHP